MTEPHNHSRDISLTEHIVSTDPISPPDDSYPTSLSVPASILVGAILISASIFYNTSVLVNKVLVPAAAVPAAAANQAAVKQAPSPIPVSLKPGVPFKGNADAKVTVIEYADYRCPFCEKFYTTVMPDLKSKYIDTGKIKFVYQDFAFLGADSYAAAEASHCAADQGKFWEYHDYLFGHQGSESGDWASIKNQKIFAKTLKLKTALFNSCLDSHKYKQQVLDETAAGKSYGVTGTPTVFVNGVALVGAQPLSTFTDAIDAALK
jgi:protein-disulfide isomerase